MIELLHVAETGSTSEDLKARAMQGGGEVALRATRQLGGRGRLGRSWTSPPGNLYLSVLLRPAGPVMPGHWSLLAAVALAACVSPLVPGRVRLKWPNDVMLDGGKLAGILLETGADPAWLVIGFGVNLVEAPAGLGRKVACLADHTLPPPAQDLARVLLDQLAHWRRTYESQGFAPVLAAWRAWGPDPGETVGVTSPAGRIEGRFHGIAPSGALLLDQGGTLRTLVSGEVE